MLYVKSTLLFGKLRKKKDARRPNPRGTRIDVFPLGGVSCLINPGLSFLSSLVESLNSRAMTLSSVLGGASMVSHRSG